MVAEVLLVLGGHHAALGGLLDRQADAPTLEIEIDDLDPQLLARGDHLLGQVDVVRRHLRDVDEALDAVADLDERTERNELGDPAVDQLADAVGVEANSCQGSCWVAFSERLMRSRSRSTSRTSTSISSPTVTTELGWSTCFHDSSETCTRPSMPPRSTKAPKLTTDDTTPLRRSRRA